MAFKPPCIGKWYQDISTGDVFEIVALDDYSGTIEIQFENGDISEMEFESWSSEDFIQVSNPECSDLDYGLDTDDEDDDVNLMDDHSSWRYHSVDADFDDLGGFEGGV